MATLTSANTLTEIKAAYLDNSGYAGDNSVAAAQIFVQACRMLLLMTPSKSTHGRGGSVEFNLDQLQRQLQEARAWIAQHGTADVIHPSFGNFRDYPPGSSFPYSGGHY